MTSKVQSVGDVTWYAVTAIVKSAGPGQQHRPFGGIILLFHPRAVKPGSPEWPQLTCEYSCIYGFEEEVSDLPRDREVRDRPYAL
jgi:hypothetical protein